jgi:hypothetical protein
LRHQQPEEAREQRIATNENPAKEQTPNKNVPKTTLAPQTAEGMETSKIHAA